MDYKDIVKTDNIIRISPGTSLSTALAQLSSSHDSAFVFDDSNTLLGVINPYYALIKKSFPGNAKVQHILYHAPKVRNRYSISKVAQLFKESKLHYLPIFNDKDVFMGVASARHLLSLYRNSSLFDIQLDEYLKLKNQPVLTIFDTDLVSSAITIFKKKRISKLVVVDKMMKLKGVITYYDLISNLMEPKRKGHKGDRKAGEKMSFSFQQVKNFMKTLVLTLEPKNTLREALHLILDKKIGSVIVVDDKKTPIGVITTRDFLNFLIKGKKEKQIEISGKDLSDQSRYVLTGFFHNFRKWANRLPDVESVNVFVHEEKKGGVFHTVMKLIPSKGPATVITREGKNLLKVLKSLRVKKESRKTLHDKRRG